MILQGILLIIIPILYAKIIILNLHAKIDNLVIHENVNVLVVVLVFPALFLHLTCSCRSCTRPVAGPTMRR